MTHNIMDNDKFIGRYPAWHGLGLVADEDYGAQEALRRLGGGFIVEKSPLYAQMEDGTIIPTGHFGVIRHPTPQDRNYRVFAVAKRYELLAPDEIAAEFDAHAGVPVETLFFLGDGERMGITWKQESLFINGDEIQTYGFLGVGSDRVSGINLAIVTLRVVCENTWVAALSQAMNGGDGNRMVWRATHAAKDVKTRLGLWLEHITENAARKREAVGNLFAALDAIPVESDDLAKLLFQISPPPKEPSRDMPKSLFEEAFARYEVAKAAAEGRRESIGDLFNGAGTEIQPTALGLFHAVTEHENWLARKASPASVMAGAAAKRMNSAMRVITDYYR